MRAAGIADWLVSTTVPFIVPETCAEAVAAKITVKRSDNRIREIGMDFL
jgi:hypothetical protein